MTKGWSGIQVKQKGFSIRQIHRLSQSSYFRSLLIRILNAALALIASILLARLLGPDEYGRYAILLSLATILGIPFKAGLPRTITRDIAAARANGDPGRVREIIRLGVKTFFLIIPVVLLFTVFLWFLGYEAAGVAFGVILAGILSPLLAADSNRMAIMRGLGSAIKSQIPDMLILPVSTVLIIVGLITWMGTASAEVGLLTYSAATLVGFVVGAVMARSETKKVPNVPQLNTVSRGRFFGSVATMSLLGASASITGNIDMLLLNHFGSFADAGYYKVAMAGLAVVVLGGNAVSAVAFTRLAETVPSGDFAKVAAQSDQALRWSVLFTTIVTAVIFFFGRPVIKLLYGTQFSDAWLVLMILSVGFTIALLFGQGQDVASLADKQIWAAACVFVGILVTVVFSFLAVEHLGAIAIALGSMIGTIVRYFLVAVVVRISLGIDITIFGLVSRKLENRSK